MANIYEIIQLIRVKEFGRDDLWLAFSIDYNPLPFDNPIHAGEEIGINGHGIGKVRSRLPAMHNIEVNSSLEGFEVRNGTTLFTESDHSSFQLACDQYFAYRKILNNLIRNSAEDWRGHAPREVLEEAERYISSLSLNP